MTAAEFRIDEIEFSERPIVFRMPFRYGIVTLRKAPQSFVTVRVSDGAGRSATGRAADMLAPKWFDKNPDLTNEENFDQLRVSQRIARDLYLAADGVHTPFGLHAMLDKPQHEAAAAEGLNGLVGGFGNATVDRAILDAVCRLHDVSFFDAVAANLMGLTGDVAAVVAPDMADFDFPAFLKSLSPADRIACRHTVGLTDHLTEVEIADRDRIGDGLPESLEANVAAYGLRSFKVKVGGDTAADIDRLTGIAAVLDRIDGDYVATLDGNEQYDSIEAFAEFFAHLSDAPALARFRAAIKAIEQPIARAKALDVDLGEMGRTYGFEIDESDADIGVFPAAKALGYTGISSKSCKGAYRGLINAARVARWNAEADSGGRYFIAAEDLTTQPGIAVQQDLALATTLGCEDVERNGHQYGDGMGAAPAEERAAFAADHADMYGIAGDRLNLKITDGEISLASLRRPGFGT
ncbi:MAG: mandelate racemase [Alphaproteobacteria bacterium]